MKELVTWCIPFHFWSTQLSLRNFDFDPVRTIEGRPKAKFEQSINHVIIFALWLSLLIHLQVVGYNCSNWIEIDISTSLSHVIPKRKLGRSKVKPFHWNRHWNGMRMWHVTTSTPAYIFWSKPKWIRTGSKWCNPSFDLLFLDVQNCWLSELFYNFRQGKNDRSGNSDKSEIRLLSRSYWSQTKPDLVKYATLERLLNVQVDSKLDWM